MNHRLKHIDSYFKLRYWALKLPFIKHFAKTKYTQTPITFRMWFMQKVLGFNKKAYWPVHHSSVVNGAQNVYCGIETCPGYMPGCYVQAVDKIYIGDYTQIASGVGLIASNHDLYDSRKHVSKGPIRIGKYGWIGMNAVILPGVELGNHCIVAAGAVVTKSFKDGYVVLAGNPAKVIKALDPEKCQEFRSEFEYNGYIASSNFKAYKQKYLNI